MAEEIVQRMGFDTGDSVSQLDALRVALDNINTSIGTVAASLKAFNSSGAGMDKAMSDLTTKVDSILAKFNSLGNVQAPSLKVDTSAALKQIRELTAEWGRAPKGQASIDLTSAKTALANYVATSKASAAEVSAAFANIGKGGTTGLDVEVNKLAQAFKNLTPSVSEATNKVAGYFEQVGKIALLRAGIAVIQEIKEGLNEGAKAAQDFSIKLAQSQGIMDDTSLSIGEVATAVKATSEAFARPLGETNQAFYQTLQNQVGGATESLYLFTQAAKLATANQIPLNDAVNLLTSSMKGWGTSVFDAGHQSGLFFEAIKIGRFEASDLADVLGRIGPSAKELGVSLEEAMAGVAIMTQQGTLASTAITQMAAAMTALTKPSAELKKTMTDVWGVKNAEEAIAKFGGLRGVFAEIEKISGGTSDGMSALIKNIRAMRAEMGLAGENATAWGDATDRLRNATEKTVGAASDLVLNSAGGQAQKAANDLALAWESLGEKLLPAKTAFIDITKLVVQLADTMTNSWASWPALIVATTAALQSFGKTIIAATASTAKFVATWALTPWGAVAVGLAVGVGLGIAISDYISKLDDATAKQTEFIDAAKKASKAQTDDLVEQLSAQSRAQKAADEARLQGMVSVFSQARVLIQREQQETYQENAAIVAVTKNRFDRILSAQKSYIDTMINAETAAAQKVMALQGEISAMKQTLADKQFDLDNKQNNWIQQNINNQTRANQLQRDAITALSQARTPEEIAQAVKFAERAENFVEKALAGEKDIVGQYSKGHQLQEQILRLEQLKIDAKEKAVQLTIQEGKAQNDSIIAGQTNLEKLTAAFKIIEQGSKLTNADNSKKTSQQAEADAKRVADAWAEVEKIKNTQPNFNLSDFLGVNKIGSNINAQLNALGPLERELTLKVKLENESLLSAFNSLGAKQQELLGPNANKFDVLGQFSGDAVKAQEALNNINAKLDTFNATAVKTKGVLSEMLRAIPQGEQLKAFLDNLDQNGGDPQLAINFKQMADAAQRLSTTSAGTKEWNDAFDTLQQKVSKFKEWYESLGNLKPLSILQPSDFAPFEAMLKVARQDFESIGTKPIELRIEKAKIEGELRSIRNVAAEIQGPIDGVIQGLQAFTPPINNVTTAAIPAMNNALLSIPAATAPGVTAMAQLAAAAWEAANAIIAANQAAASSGSGGTSSEAFGGVIRKASGGFVSNWKDTVPAMLQRKEFVVKASAAQRFAPQLQAMNSGANPVFRAQGGPVTNVGDISVNVNGGDTSAQTIRSIGIGLRRAIKQGTVKLN